MHAMSVTTHSAVWGGSVERSSKLARWTLSPGEEMDTLLLNDVMRLSGYLERSESSLSPCEDQLTER